MHWINKRERNTKKFHTFVKGRRNRSRVSRIQNDEGEWLENQEDIAQGTISFYKDQFIQQATSDDFEMLNELAVMITE